MTRNIRATIYWTNGDITHKNLTLEEWTDMLNRQDVLGMTGYYV